ncbi:SCO family protein [Cocleimonas flava]|jgi:protein SCO1/2|uniref:Protein SCO1/2 n=1 Tax=Cocleimonas flava TaxID=634765 RepID=A0A4R1F3S3_9GAMM|nr:MULTISPECIES: SCO family protein [Cocleimonas]MEB8433429.1 SCO family protein [Cocleimonas sp. KMM 6892]MEC4716240.1 SCO family protein [Cocleimonas sp. KMM 6895]MEC4745867.1 SCO family protein [Cocleimonas sp. KMM 6896]TCJ85071.1 protein SCO1/2 [Cocleimonas flava]
MSKALIPLSIIALVLGLVIGNSFFEAPKPKSGEYIDPPGGDFTLQSINGDVSLSDYKGKVTLLYFGYTFCPDVCPTSLSRVGAAFKKLNEDELKHVQGILISVDPDRDTLQKLADYTKYFHPQIVGITGTKEKIDEIAARYDVKYRKAEGTTAASYLVDHTAYIFVLDKTGKIREYLPHAVEVDRAVEVIRKLINE